MVKLRTCCAQGLPLPIQIPLECYKTVATGLSLLTLSPIYLLTSSLLNLILLLVSFSTPSAMVGTRTKNKDSHPAAPVMTEAAKIKAGIPSTKRRTKKPTKDKQIPQLEARLTAFEHPDETTPVSNEPLVSPPSLSHSNPHLTLTQFTRGSSPPDDGNPPVAKSEAPTEVGSDDFVVVGGK